MMNRSISAAAHLVWQVFTRTSRVSCCQMLVPQKMAQPGRRSVFSDSYLGVDVFVRNSNRLKLTMANEEGFRTKIRETFETSQLNDLFTEDLSNLIEVCDNEGDARVAADILKYAIGDNTRTIGKLPVLMSRFFLMCKHKNFMSVARETWQDPVVAASGLLCKRSARVRYFALLYQNKLYQELMDTYLANPEDATLDDATLAMAALYHLGTDEAFRQAVQLMKEPPLKPTWSGHREKRGSAIARSTVGSRAIYIYAYHAFKRGQRGHAFDVLTDRSLVGRRTKISTNLKLSILTEVGRLVEATQLIRTELLPEDNRKTRAESSPDDSRKKHVCFEVMQSLAAAIRQRYESNSEIGLEFASLCKILDDSAVLCDKTLEQIVFEPIEGHRGRKA